MSPKNSAKAWFANLRAVVIDEVHAFAADDRGGHLSCVLERLVLHAPQYQRPIIHACRVPPQC